MSFNKKYNDIKQKFEHELSEIDKILINSVNIKEPLNSYVINFLAKPSKKIRSVLSLLFLKASEAPVTESQIKLLSSIELIHNASLIHDDIIDESDLRRGEKSVHSKFGTKLGVIAGDYLLSLAMEKISELNSNYILQKFSHTLKQMCIGEIDQNYSRFKIGTIEEYIEKTKKKTAYLFETAIVTALFLSEYDDYSQQASVFGLNTGIAFQIRDDLVNLISNDETKPDKSDIKEGIYNAPIIYSQNISDYSNGIEKTKILLNNYIDLAKSGLSDLPDNEYSQTLYDFLELLNNE